jgi:hypothetical protein
VNPPADAWLPFLLITGVIGGGAAWMTGRAIAQTWRPYWHVLVYAALLAAAVRFIHFALFGDDLLSPAVYAVAALYLMALGTAAWRMTRAAQMTRQYAWLVERRGPFTWRPRRDGDGDGGVLP